MLSSMLPTGVEVFISTSCNRSSTWTRKSSPSSSVSLRQKAGSKRPVKASLRSLDPPFSSGKAPTHGNWSSKSGSSSVYSSITRAFSRPPGKPRVAASLIDMITHPKWKYSKSPKETAYQLAYETDLLMFDHVYRQPEVAKAFANSIRVCAPFLTISVHSLS